MIAAYLNSGNSYFINEVNELIEKKKIDFKTFCQVIEGTVIAGPKSIRIQHFSNRIKHMKNPHTAVFVKSRKKKIKQHRNRSSNPSAIIFDKRQSIDHYLPNIVYIQVDHIQRAYWKFVNHYRIMHDIPVFSITGTCGKTTVKEMIAHMLKSKYQVVATNKSRNGPKRNLHYLSQITNTTDVAVFETPVGFPGSLAKSCKYFQPTIGMITNIGVDHLNLFGTIENYTKAKGEIIQGLGNKGTLLLNADDERTKEISLRRFKGKLLYFGVQSPADYQASAIRYVPNGMRFTLEYQQLQYPVFIPGYGEHQVYNALSAIAAVHQMGFGISEAIDQLQTFKNINSHIETGIGYNGATVIDDTWNSNPTSIEACLKVLENIGANKKKIAVIGSISWLGDNESDIHRAVGKMIANYEIDTLITYGQLAQHIAEGAKGMTGEIFTCQTADALEKTLLPLLDKEIIVLLKTSMKDYTLKTLVSKVKASPE